MEVINSLPWSNVTASCNGNLSRSSCQLSEAQACAHCLHVHHLCSLNTETAESVQSLVSLVREPGGTRSGSRDYIGERDVIAVIRLVTSLLSIVGAFSIIGSAIYRKQVCSPKVHPIFMLSIADCLLGFLWVVGGSLWLRAVSESRVGCFAVSLMTVILECVAVNLTLVYALLAYSGIKQKDFSSVYVVLERSSGSVWKPSKTVLAYLLAWTIPLVLIMLSFGLVAGVYDIVGLASLCSCWCLPYFGNVLPMAFPGDEATAAYMYHMRMLLASYGLVVGTNYLVVFVLLVIIYYKILKRIKRMRVLHDQTRETHHLYGAAEAGIIRGQSRAKTRVVYFLTVFVISGLSNVVLSYAFTVFEGIQLHEGVHIKPPPYGISTAPLIVFLLQSITVPLQGFLNAIVYGWTREDFLHVMVRTTVGDQAGRASLLGEGEGEKSVEDSGILTSVEDKDHSFSVEASIHRAIFPIPEQTETEDDD